MINCFAPIIDETSTILVLGSIPSVTSLEKQEYYGFSHNRFWKIISAFSKQELLTYEDKINCIKQQKIALWDVIKNCEREGSLDSHIKQVVPNDLISLLKKYPQISCILCNGKKSYALYQKHFASIPISCICMPSTSNANRSISEEALYSFWLQQLKNNKNSF